MQDETGLDVENETTVAVLTAPRRSVSARGERRGGRLPDPTFFRHRAWYRYRRHRLCCGTADALGGDTLALAVCAQHGVPGACGPGGDRGCRPPLAGACPTGLPESRARERFAEAPDRASGL